MQASPRDENGQHSQNSISTQMASPDRHQSPVQPRGADGQSLISGIDILQCKWRRILMKVPAFFAHRQFWLVQHCCKEHPVRTLHAIKLLQCFALVVPRIGVEAIRIHLILGLVVLRACTAIGTANAEIKCARWWVVPLEKQIGSIHHRVKQRVVPRELEAGPYRCTRVVQSVFPEAICHVPPTYIEGLGFRSVRVEVFREPLRLHVPAASSFNWSCRTFPWSCNVRVEAFMLRHPDVVDEATCNRWCMLWRCWCIWWRWRCWCIWWRWRCWCSTSISTRGSVIWERRYLYLGDEWSTRGSTKGHCGWCSDCLWLGIQEFAFKTLNSLAHLGMRLVQIIIFLLQFSMVLSCCIQSCCSNSGWARSCLSIFFNLSSDNAINS